MFSYDLKFDKNALFCCNGYSLAIFTIFFTEKHLIVERNIYSIKIFLEVVPPSEMDLISIDIKSTSTDLQNLGDSFLEPGKHLFLNIHFNTRFGTMHQ